MMKNLKILIIVVLILSLTSCTVKTQQPASVVDEPVVSETPALNEPVETPEPVEEIYFPPEFLGHPVVPDATTKDACAENYLEQADGGNDELVKAHTAVLELAMDMFFDGFDEDEYFIECAGNFQDQLLIGLTYLTFEKEQLNELKEDKDFRNYWTDRYRAILLDYMEVAGIIFEKVIGETYDIGVLILDKNNEVLYAVTDYGIRNDYLFQECTFGGEELGKDLLKPAKERAYFPTELTDHIHTIAPAETERIELLSIPCRIDEYSDFSAEELMEKFYVKAEYDFQNDAELTIENFMQKMLEDNEIPLILLASDESIMIIIRFNEYAYSDFAALRESDENAAKFEKFWGNYLSSLQKIADKASEMYELSFDRSITSVSIEINDMHGMKLYEYRKYDDDWQYETENDFVYEKYDEF